MSEGRIWLGTISAPYESPAYSVVGETKQVVMSDLLDELQDHFGEEHSNPEWVESSETYMWLDNSRESVEVRKVEFLRE